MVKKCSRKNCTQLNPQPITNFNVCSRLKSGRRPECKACRKLEETAKYAANPAKILARNIKWELANPEAAKRARIEAELNAKPYRRHKKDKCEECGFVPVDMCQLDVDHIDGNHKNNAISNLQTLCANCHRLKTKLNKEGAYSDARVKRPHIAIIRGLNG